jgi:hypothetical protein
VYLSPAEHSVIREGETLNGGGMLPDFNLTLADLFPEPPGPQA